MIPKNAPCGGTKCWFDPFSQKWIHSNQSSESCSVRSVTGLVKRDKPVNEHDHEEFEVVICKLLEHLGEDPNREGLRETPARVARAWYEWTCGYSQEPKDVMKTFEKIDYDEMIVQRDIPFYSHCEHHLAPFFGITTIAYIPQGRILGLSKLLRLTEIFSRRLQVQERMTNQIADALANSEDLNPKGVGVLIKARHLCMESRGVCKQGQHTITSALRGVLFSDAKARSEFLDLADRSTP
jgi:GTP cyclohydrolase I